MNNQLNICLILSGSIAAYKACELVSRLVKAGHSVQTVASEGALHFIGAASLEALSGKPVYTDLWARRENMTHISLRRWADLFVFYPASANRINAMAAGLAPDLIGAIFLANNFERPFWIAPAMNSNMLAHPATQSSIRRLADWGCRIIESETGSLACGDEGTGRLAEPAAVFEAITTWAATRQQSVTPILRRLLLTGGAMSEPVDAVRSITNSSSGATARIIAETFVSAGWTVDFLHHDSVRDVGCPPLLACESYHAFGDFSQKLSALLQRNPYDAVIHAAAVSDYHVASVQSADSSSVPTGQGKLESQTTLNIRLAANPKLLPTIRGQSRPGASGKTIIVAFKLTVGENETQGSERAGKFLDQGQADLVVWNDLAAMQSTGTHPFCLFGQGPSAFDRGQSNQELAAALLKQIETDKIPNRSSS